MGKFINNLNRIKRYFLPAIFIFLINIPLTFFSVYLIFPWIDIPMHFFGGISVGYLFFMSLKYFQSKKYFELNSLSRIIFVFALVSTIAVFWEFYEFIMTFLTGYAFQGDLPDTMKDLFFGMFGGLVSALFLERKYKGYFSSK